MKRRLLVCLLAALLPGVAVHAAATAPVHASHAWIRVLPGGLPAGAYVTLHNDSDRTVALTAASSPRYAEVMLHHSSTAGGMSRMAMVDALTIPAHGSAALAPAGYHLMLMGATAPVQVGDRVRLTLRFADGTTLPVDFLARPANAVDAGDRSTP